MANMAEPNFDDIRREVGNASGFQEEPVFADDSDAGDAPVVVTRPYGQIKDDEDWRKANEGKWNFPQLLSTILSSQWKRTSGIPSDDKTTNFTDRPPAKHREVPGERRDYYEYVPPWTDPEFEAERPTGKGFFRGNFFNRMYPAQTDESLAKNPTEMAKRYGIHPNRTDGRSGLSPAWAISRRYQLQNGESVGAEDIDRFLQENYFASKEAKASGESIDEYIKKQSLRVAKTGEEVKLLEMWKICRKHTEDIQQDQNFQRLVFDGYTTDELHTQGLFSFTEDVLYDLDGPLHELVDQHRWLPPRASGATTEESPRQIWEFKDEDGSVREGEWTAQDPHVWAALQPALQVLTRLLNSNHPAWTGLMNLYTRLKVDRNLDPLAEDLIYREKLGVSYNYRSAWHTEIPKHSTDRQFEELLKLRRLRFDASSWVAKVLMEKIVLRIESCYRIQTEPNRCLSAPIYGVTNYRVNKDGKITISIGAELIWPLLSCHISKSEKLVCSMSIAAVLFHEFSHAVFGAQLFSLEPTCRQLVPNPEHRPYLEKAGLALFYTAIQVNGIMKEAKGLQKSEVFFENEPQEEPGFAVENQTFGGFLICPLRHVTTYGPVPAYFHMTQLSMATWPSAEPQPWSEHTGASLGLLKDPPLSLAHPSIKLPMDLVYKFFRQSFWDTDLVKYGCEALKLHSDQALRSHFVPPHHWTAWIPIYGEHRGDWLSEAVYLLNRTGYGVLANCIDSIAKKRLLGLSTRQYWLYERKTWPKLGKDLDQVATELRQSAIRYMPNFKDAVMTAAERRNAFVQRGIGAQFSGVLRGNQIAQAPRSISRGQGGANTTGHAQTRGGRGRGRGNATGHAQTRGGRGGRGGNTTGRAQTRRGRGGRGGSTAGIAQTADRNPTEQELKDWVADLEDTRSPKFNLFVSKLMQMDRVLSIRFRYIQILLGTLLRLEPSDRAVIRRKHIERLRGEITHGPVAILSNLRLAMDALIRLYRLRLARLMTETDKGPEDPVLCQKLQHEVQIFQKHQGRFGDLEVLFKKNLTLLGEAGVQWSWASSNQRELVGLTSLDVSGIQDVYLHAATSDVEHPLIDTNVKRVFVQALEMLESWEKEKENPKKQPPPPPTASALTNLPSPGPSNNLSASRSRKRPAENRAAKETTKRTRSYEQSHSRPTPNLTLSSTGPETREAGISGASGPENDVLMLDEEVNFVLPAVQPAAPPPPGLIRVQDPQTGFSQYVPASRAADVEPTMQQAAYDLEVSAANAQQILDEIEAQEATPKAREGLLTAAERTRFRDLENLETTDFEALFQMRQLIQAFDSIGTWKDGDGNLEENDEEDANGGGDGEEEDVNMDL